MAMNYDRRPWKLISSRISRMAKTALLIVFVVVAFAIIAQAQTFEVLYNFTSDQAGGVPRSLVLDKGGNLYGTTFDGGYYGGDCYRFGGSCGTVFKLSKRASGWLFNTLYSFTGNNYGDGSTPAGLVFGSDGSLYGTTTFGGGTLGQCCGGCGTVFQLKPPASPCHSSMCSWSATILHRFTGTDGDQPVGNPVFDRSGNLFGSSYYGGIGDCYGGCYPGCGVVWKLTPGPDGWITTVLHSFNGYDGATPMAGVTLDDSGSIYGTTTAGGEDGYGTVFQLAPLGSAWELTTLQVFQMGPDGIPALPLSAPIIDSSGNLFGSTCSSGSRRGGMIFELTLAEAMRTFVELYGFDGPSYPYSGPDGDLVMNKYGDLYGITRMEGGTGCGGYGCGTVFRLTHSHSGWRYQLLHSFNGDDGAFPEGNVAFDGDGNLYGITGYGGTHGRGVVFRIKPTPLPTN